MIKLQKLNKLFLPIMIILMVLSSLTVIAAKRPKTTTTTTTTTTTPTTTPTVTTATYLKEVYGFTTYYYTGDKSSYNSMVSNTKSLSGGIITATHVTDSYGNLSGIIPTEQINYANQNKMNVMLMIGNNFSGSVAKTLLESSSNRQNLINNILNTVRTYNYKGVNIDLEGVYSSDRTYYNTFMSELYSTLKPLGYSISISVPAKTVDSVNATWNYAYDYQTLAKYCDRFVIMTYDEHYPGGTPGAIASINWVNNVIKYALTTVPKEKIIVGLAAYGYDWYQTTTKSYSIGGCYSLATNNGTTVLWDDVSKAPYFNYVDSTGISHSVWFENANSIAFKLDLVKNYDVAGVAIWRLGLENVDYWNTINSKLFP